MFVFIYIKYDVGWNIISFVYVTCFDKKKKNHRQLFTK